MIVGEPTLMGGEFGDKDERLIARLENTQYDPSELADEAAAAAAATGSLEPSTSHSLPTSVYETDCTPVAAGLQHGIVHGRPMVGGPPGLPLQVSHPGLQHALQSSDELHVLPLQQLQHISRSEMSPPVSQGLTVLNHFASDKQTESAPIGANNSSTNDESKIMADMQ
jgi:hypothetical protein